MATSASFIVQVETVKSAKVDSTSMYQTGTSSKLKIDTEEDETSSELAMLFVNSVVSAVDQDEMVLSAKVKSTDTDQIDVYSATLDWAQVRPSAHT